MTELWDLYDQYGNRTGKFHERGKPIPPGYFHTIVHVWIKSEEGNYLMSQRHPLKSYPLLWECTGGSVLAGEESLAGAMREVREELGVILDEKKGSLFKSERQDAHQIFYNVYLFRQDEDVPLHLQAEEVVDARWMKPAEIRQLAKAGEMMPMLNYYEDVFGTE